MFFSKFNENEIRGLCKEAIETLEYWLRQIVDEELKTNFGENYIDAIDINGDRIIRNSIAIEIQTRQVSEPNRYPRIIDATFLDDLTTLICNPKLYRVFFSKYFQNDFPNNNETLRVILKRITTPRNHLSHSNPISNRQAEQVICYCHDIIDSIKSYYLTNKIHMDFNVPRIIQLKDSFGNVRYFNQDGYGNSAANFINDENSILRVGDVLELEVKVDESFSNDEYEIIWRAIKRIPEFGNTNKISIKIENHHIGEQFNIQCVITSKKDWHRMQEGYDDLLLIYYKVLPPLS